MKPLLDKGFENLMLLFNKLIKMLSNKCYIVTGNDDHPLNDNI